MFSLPPGSVIVDPSLPDVGHWHASVQERSRLLAQYQSTDIHYALRRLTRVTDKDDPAVWDRPVPDPRDCTWEPVPANGSGATLYAERIWNPTGMILEKGRTYRVTVDKAQRQWVDLTDVTTADGLSSWCTVGILLCKYRWWRRPLALLSPRFWVCWAKRRPVARWMQLIGMINPPTDWQRRTLPGYKLFKYLLFTDPEELHERQVSLGNDVVFTADRTGPLYCYANDLWITAGNNAGAIRVMVKPENAKPTTPADDGWIVGVMRWLAYGWTATLLLVLLSILLWFVIRQLIAWGLPAIDLQSIVTWLWDIARDIGNGVWSFVTGIWPFMQHHPVATAVIVVLVVLSAIPCKRPD